MSEDQLQPQDTLDDRGVDDILDEGISPPEHLRGSLAKGVTAREELEGETIDERLRQEEPEVWEDAEEESDAEILDAKATVGAGGLGCEPASGASVAGLLKLVKEGVIAPSDRVVCVLTGHVLKDPDATVAYHTADPAHFAEKLGKRGVKRVQFANRAVQVPNDLAEIVKAIELYA